MISDPPSSQKGAEPSFLQRLTASLFHEPASDAHEQFVSALRAAKTNGVLSDDALFMIEGVLKISELSASDIMVPRSQIKAIDISEPQDKWLREANQSGHSRFPVIEGDFSDVKGLLHAKDLLTALLHPDYRLDLSDGMENLRTALAMAASGVPGVFLAFDRKVILGCRAVKTRTTDFDAFESVNWPLAANVDGKGLQIHREAIPATAGACALRDKLCDKVFLIKLTPGLDPEIFDMLLQMHYRGIVIEAFGAGGLHFVRRDLIAKLQAAARAGMTVVVCSQCLYEPSDFSVYEVGQRALAQGVILGSLGPVLAGRLDSPFLALAKSVGVEGAFQRVESVVAALWVTADVTMAGLLVFALRAMASAAVPRYQEEWVGRGAVLLAAIAALLLPGRQVETLERLALGANLWFGLLLPILLAVWIKLHKRG